MHSVDDISRLIATDPWRMEILNEVAQLGLADWAIGAGFVRNAVWDVLSGYRQSTPLNDIDVLYFAPTTTNPEADKTLKETLKSKRSEEIWSVKNQARMHVRNGDSPYASTVDAIAHWLETPTCIAARLGPGGRVIILAPHGIKDLLGLRIAPTPSGRRKADQYEQRVTGKGWQETWPGLKIEYL